jgi:hypothetical protein
MNPVTFLERYGPVGLVPLAWTFTGIAVFTTLASERTVLIGLGVMTAIFAVFALQPDMGEGVLRIWRGVLVGGFLANVVGLAGLLVAALPRSLAAVSLAGWLLLPTVGLVLTGRQDPEYGQWHQGFAVLAGIGAIQVGAGIVAFGDTVAIPGLALVALGQTGSVLLAAYQNTPGMDATV